MIRNTATWDRAIRLLAGIAIIMFVPSPWSWLGVVPIATAIMGYCPLYHLFGWSTCRTPARAH